MGVFGSKGTKTYQTVPEYPKLGTKEECKDEVARGKLQYYFGYGDTELEALEALAAQCKHHGVPAPKQVPNTTDNWYCGIFDAPKWTKTKKRYNTVWFTQRNKRWKAATYYPPMAE